ncbi:MAG: Plug domain-containing protein [Cytophagales bacterium]|nr:Plug domain-containing protein [Cytophagales bacterium]MCA6383661.1 Plug domain-containing protein [Cytophagales bacterium]
MRVFIFGVFFLASLLARAQREDTIRNLQEVIVQAFASEKPLEQVAASVAIVNAKELNRFNNTSLLPALNAIAGVRMEERSPGSFRLAIRGSSLRSPFGIRNVKFYWNGLPLTDGGGNTYFKFTRFQFSQSNRSYKRTKRKFVWCGHGRCTVAEFFCAN